jgi:ABC-type polysaccharide/polyol phosphate export permease
MWELIRLAYERRALIWLLALKELKVRYNRSALGFLWALLSPLLLALVLTLVFSSLLRVSIERYPIFLLSTLFPWTFFSQSLNYATQSIVTNGPLLKKVYVPPLVFPLAAVLANLMNFLLTLVPLALLLVVFDFPFHATWFFLPVPIVALVLFTTGVGLVFATVNVFLRDIGQVLQIILSVWFYFSPIIYDLGAIHPRFQWFFQLNPMHPILRSFRLAIYGDVTQGLLPSPELIGIALGGGLLALVVGQALFRRYQDSFALYV